MRIENVEMTDYLKEGDVGFKKPKTKKKRPSRRMGENSDITGVKLESDEMQVDEKPIVPRQRNLDTNFVDDDELQAALARSRRAKIQKPKKLSPEELAKKSLFTPFFLIALLLIATSFIVTAERARSTPANGDAIKVDDDVEEGGLVFDDTSEFVRAITYDPTAVKQEPPAEPPLSRARSQQPPESPKDVEMKGEDEVVEEIEAGEVVVKEEDEEDSEAMLNAIENAIKEQERLEQAEANGEVPVGTASEQTFSSGMAATLSILRSQGVLAQTGADQAEREKVQKQRDLWLADYRRMLDHRELERARMRGGNKDQQTREYENRSREQQEARQTMDLYKNYKPDVEIKYHDEFGRELTPKEAWKALSHKFHGKGSGRMKTEKRLKKIAEEKKQEAMASGDTPLSMNQAFQMRQEKAGQAHFVLSVGNRGYVYKHIFSIRQCADPCFDSAVPQAAEFLDAQPLSKGKTEKKKEKKNKQKASTPQIDSGFITLPAPSLYNGSPAPMQGVGSASNGSPAPRPGFSRISSSVVEVGSPREGGTPVPADRSKVVIGLNKRKAGEEAAGTPPPKTQRR